MARKIRIEFPGALYHVSAQSSRGWEIFPRDADREDFLATLGDACRKSGFIVHAYCLMSDHLHLVLETPEGNLASGMRWLMSNYSVRLKLRRKQPGPIFSGRYKALLTENSDPYFKAICDFVHLRPAEEGLIRSRDPLAVYRWSSLPSYLTTSKDRPDWLQTTRLLNAHGIVSDHAAGRRAFERAMESMRMADNDWKEIRRGWCFGGQRFKTRALALEQKLLLQIRSGKQKQSSAEKLGSAIIREELERRGWTRNDLRNALKADPVKLEIADRLRNETTLTLPRIAELLEMGSWKGAVVRYHSWRKAAR